MHAAGRCAEVMRDRPRRAGYGQLPPFGIERAVVSFAHMRSQVLPVEHDTEHEAVHVMWQVEFPVHDTLPLAPSVAVRSDPDVVLMLHDWLHEPAQVL
jgi:hypothetical protein